MAKISYWQSNPFSWIIIRLIAKGDKMALSLLDHLEKLLYGLTSKSYQSGDIFGFPGALLPVFTVIASLIGLFFNPNNIQLHWGDGEHVESCKLERDTFSVFHQLEREFLSWLAELFNTDEKSAYGYVTTGGTESNIYAMWTMRNHFRNVFPGERIQVIMAGEGFSHYSFLKGIDLLGLDPRIIEINYDKDLNFHIDMSQIDNLPTFIVLNAPSINTGIIDSPQILKLLSQKITAARIWCHVDAAFGGYILGTLPAVLPKDMDFSNPLIKSMTFDPHKTGFAPYSTGVIIINCKDALGVVKTKAGYLSDHFDFTLAGSRSGANVAAAWSAMRILKAKGFGKIWQQQIYKAQRFIDYFQQSSFFEVIGNPTTPVFAVRLVDEKLKDDWMGLVDKHKIVPCVIKIDNVDTKIYRFAIMPHVKEKNITQFLNTLDEAIEKHVQKAA
jgi:tyrosine decarboxylase / aspartate 1-decarboxylase